MNFKNLVIALALTLFASQSALAVESAELPKKKRTKLELYMTPADAHEFLKENADKTLFLDVRTRTEINFLGMPTTADANVPYMVMNEWYAWDAKKNNFKMVKHLRVVANVFTLRMVLLVTPTVRPNLSRYLLSTTTKYRMMSFLFGLTLDA
mgnify:CR=1 FL=1